MKSKFKTKILAFSLVAFSAAGVSAAENPFEGFFIGLNVSTVGTITEVTGATNADLGQQTIVPAIEASYAYGLTNEISLGITGTYDLSNTQGGSSGANSFKGKNHYSINFKPGYLVSPNTMLFGLVGYHSIRGTLTTASASNTQNLNGVGVGFGLQTLVSKNIYVKAEAQHVMYSSESTGGSTFKPNETLGTLGVGFRY
jgi:opacity protein-like surface antigen